MRVMCGSRRVPDGRLTLEPGHLKQQINEHFSEELQ